MGRKNDGRKNFIKGERLIMNLKKCLGKCAAILFACTMLTVLLAVSAPALGAEAAVITGDEWTTPRDVRVGQIDARTMILPFNDIAAAKANPTLKLAEDNSPNVINLNGTWKFNWVSKPSEKPNVDGVTSIPASYYDITVPSSWQTNMKYAGWNDEVDWPIYSNQNYPWQASGNGIAAQPANTGAAAPTAYNPVGTYMRTVNIPAEDIGKRFIISFMGVESGFYLYVNGQAVGYGEDSFTQCEFDITDYLRAGENLITAQVYHYTTGSYLENQDMIYFSGIHRDVYITMQPKVAIFDYNVETTFVNHNYNSGTLELSVDVANTSAAAASNYKVLSYLYDDTGAVVSSVNGLSQTVSPAAGGKATARFTPVVASPKLWSAEHPNLYTLVMVLQDASGNTLQTVSKRVGFREFYVHNAGTTNSTSEMRINGQNIEFYGVNRGEAHPAGGHHVPYADLVKDVTNAKQLNINAFRTSHFPSDPHIYDLADEYGIYIMDEVNVESHNGRTSVTIPEAEKYQSSTNGSDRVFPGNDKRYANAMVDRMTSMVMRDKSHASVLIYSLGNEAGTDKSDSQVEATKGNFNRMIDVIKALDADKLIHYQGWNDNSRVDLVGFMYPANYNQSAPTNARPYITMEYQHSMGNTGGSLAKYTDVFERDARRQGGFIWDYVDQSAYTPIPGSTGELTRDQLYLGFDGSWKQNSGGLNFCANGFVYPDRTWKPECDEVKQFYQDIKFTQTDAQKNAKQVVMVNYNRFKNANEYDIVWSLLEDGKVVDTGTLTDAQTDLAPPQGSIAAGSTKTLTIPYTVPSPIKAGAEYTLLIQYKLKEDALYAKKGYVQGSEQFALPEAVKGEDKSVDFESLPDMTTVNSAAEITITGTTEGKPFSIKFDKTKGLLTEYKANGKNLLSKAPIGSFFRPETDQNSALSGTGWASKGEAYDGWYDQGENMKNVSVTVNMSNPKFTKVNVVAQLQNNSDYAVTYAVYGNGTIVVSAKLTPSSSAPAQLGEYGMWMQVPSEFENMTWYGRGPGETYWDRKGSNTIGVWESTVEAQFFPYTRVQETGNKTDVRWLALTNDDGVGLLAGMNYGEGYSGMPLEAVALHYTPNALSSWRSKARYPWQAQKDADISLRLLTHQKGVGNLDWGSEPVGNVLEKTMLDLFNYSYTLRPLFADSDAMSKSKEIISEPPAAPGLSAIKVNGKNVNGFSQEKLTYDVAMGSATPVPVLTATGASQIQITFTQPTAVPGTGTVHVTYKGITTDYSVNFTVSQPKSEDYLSDIVEMPTITAGNKLFYGNNSNVGNLLFAYSGYAGIYKNVNQNGASLLTGPAASQTIYPKGFAGNAAQIIDFDISGYDATSFSGVAGIDWAMKAGNSSSSIIFEVWAHKDVSQLTSAYYSPATYMNPAAASLGTNYTTAWADGGWTRLGVTSNLRASTTPYTQAFSDLSLTYDDNGTTKSYQAIRLAMNPNGSNSHDQGVWGNPLIKYPPKGVGLDVGIGDPDPEFRGISVGGMAIPGFSADKHEYTIELNSGAAAVPTVSADYDPVLYVTLKQAASLSDTATVTVDNGTPVTYTIHFTKAAAIAGDSAYLSDVVSLPALTTNTSGSNGNLLYAYSGYMGIYKDANINGSALQLRESGRLTTDTDDTVIRSYDKGFAGSAQQIMDIDLSSRNALRFTADVGVDWAQRPDTNSTNANGPAMRFLVYGHKNIGELDSKYYSGMAPTPTGGTIANSGWVLLDQSPIMSNYAFTGSGNAAARKDFYPFDVDMTYVENGVRKSYQAIRLVMDVANGSATRDDGIWASPLVIFADSVETPPVTLNAVSATLNEDGAVANYLVNSDTALPARDYRKLLAVYNSDGTMIGFNALTESTAVGNDDSDISVAAGPNYQNPETLAFMLWDAVTQAPLSGGFTMGADGEVVRLALPTVIGRADNPAISVDVDEDNAIITIKGTGFAPHGLATLTASFANSNQAALLRAAALNVDFASQVLADRFGKFEVSYRTASAAIETLYSLNVSAGGQGIDSPVVKSVSPAGWHTMSASTGETVIVPITIENCTNVAGAMGSIKYDEEYLTFESITARKGYQIVTDDNRFIAVSSDGSGADGTIVLGYVVFTAKKDLLDDVTAYVTFPKADLSVMDADLEEVSGLHIQPVAVTIVGIPPMPGDIDLGGDVDVSDAIMLMQYLSGNRELTARQLKAADVNKDGRINVGDVVIIMQMCLD